MKKQMVLGAGAAVAASACMALFGSGIAAADDYAGQTYADASAAASEAGQTVVVASRVGDKLSQDDCIVTSSSAAPFLHGDDFAHVSDTLLFHLNCNGGYATATNPGASLGSAEGRAAKAAADEAAAAEEAPLEEVSTPGA
jgi:hypothetical protein